MPIDIIESTAELAKQIPSQRVQAALCPSCGTYTSARRDLDAFLDTCDTDGEDLDTFFAEWRERVDGYNRRGERVVLWGPPVAALGFLCAIKLGTPVDALVWERPVGFLATSGTPVVAVSRLVEDPPDVVINVGTSKIEAIRALLEEHGIAPRVFSVT